MFQHVDIEHGVVSGRFGKIGDRADDHPRAPAEQYGIQHLRRDLLGELGVRLQASPLPAVARAKESRGAADSRSHFQHVATKESGNLPAEIALPIHRLGKHAQLGADIAGVARYFLWSVQWRPVNEWRSASSGGRSILRTNTA